MRRQEGHSSITVNSGEDITERKQAEERLRESEETLKSLLNAPDDISCLIDAEGTVIAANDFLARCLDRETNDLIGRNIFDLFPKEIASSRQAWIRKVLESGKPVRFEDVSADSRYFDSCIYPIFDTKGTVVSVAVHAKDITEARRAGEALAESEARFRQFFGSVNDGIALRDGQTFELLDANRRFCEMYGYTLEEMKALPLGSLGAGESFGAWRQRLITHYTEATEGTSKLFEAQGKRKDGSTFWVEAHVRRIVTGGRESLLSVSRDITERKHAEEALRGFAEETAVIAEIGRIISSGPDIDEVYERFAEAVRKLIPFDRILVNLASRRENTLTTAYAAGMELAARKKGAVVPLAGTMTEEMLRTGEPVLFHPDSLEGVQCRFPSLVPVFEAGMRSGLSVLLVARGEVIGSLSAWSRQTKAYGERDIRLAQEVATQIAGAIANAQLFRERTRAEEALRESQHVLERTFASLPAAIFIVDAQSARILHCNPTASLIFGYSPEELLGRRTEFLHVDRDALHNFREHMYAAIQSKGSFRDFRFKMRRKDGTIFPTEHSVMPLEDGSGGSMGWVSVVLDITDREQAEEKIRTSLRENEETNAALRVLLRHRDEDKKILESTIVTNIKELTFPWIEKMRAGNLTDEQTTYLGIIESNLNEVISPFLQKMHTVYTHLTPMEVQVAHMIRNGRTSKEIASLLHISKGTVDSHRNSIRSKLDLNNKDVNLRSFLGSI